MPFNDPREPWITRGILISLASLFELCKGIKVKFEGNGDYRGPHFSVPGRKAEPINNDSGDIQYVADAEFFESCIEEIRDLNVELAKAISLFRDFNQKLSVSNLTYQLTLPHGRHPEVAEAISNAGIRDTIGDFTFDFKELVELSELLQVSFRNRKSHRKLHDGSDRALVTYHHALMSRFLQLVDKCSEYTQSRGWLTCGQLLSEQSKSLPMIQNHIEEFKALTEVVFDEIGPPLHNENDHPTTLLNSSSTNQRPSSTSKNDRTDSVSNANLRDIADAIREAHDESGSYIAWLEERISSLVASTAEDLKNSLLDPWKDKNIDALLDLFATQAPRNSTSYDPSHAYSCIDSTTSTEQGAQVLDSGRPESDILTSLRVGQIENGKQQIRARLRDLCKEMRNKLNQIDPRFEFYHCVLQSPIVAPAIQHGVCSYDQLKETEQFQSRIIVNNRSFMLDEQEKMYKQRIDQILSENSPGQCPL